MPCLNVRRTGPVHLARLQVRLHHVSVVRPGVSGQRQGRGARQPPPAPPSSVDRSLVREQRDHVLPREGPVDQRQDERRRLLQAVSRIAWRPGARASPQTDYVTGSPDCGDVHFWKVWHGGKPFEVYRDIHGFVSEFGFQSFPEPKTVTHFTNTGRPRVGLFAGDEVPRAIESHVHGIVSRTARSARARSCCWSRSTSATPKILTARSG